MLHDSFRFLLSQSLEAKHSNLRAVQQKRLYQRFGWLICFMIVFVFCYPSPWRQSAPTCVQCSRSFCIPEIWMAYMLHDILLSQSLEAKRSNLRAVQQKLLYQRSGWLICFMIIFVFCYPSPWRQSAPTYLQCSRSFCTRDLDGLYAS